GPYPGYQHGAAFHLAVLKSLRTLPGVRGAAGVMVSPSTDEGDDASLHQPLIAETEGATRSAIATANMASPDYFSVMGISLLSGRSFSPGDVTSPKPGVILSAALAHELFGTTSPI